MADGILSDNTINGLQAGLNHRLIRHELHSANIANADTPEYKAKKLDFEDALARALDINGTNQMMASDERHFPVGGGPMEMLKADIYEDPDMPIKPDGNTVSVDREMAKMAENNILYDGCAELLKRKLSGIRYAIIEGGR